MYSWKKHIGYHDVLTSQNLCAGRGACKTWGETPSNTLWLATRGGDVYLSSEAGVSDKFDQAKLGSRGFGILDVG